MVPIEVGDPREKFFPRTPLNAVLKIASVSPQQ